VTGGQSRDFRLAVIFVMGMQKAPLVMKKLPRNEE